MRWRARKPITIIPGILRMNVSSAAGGGKKSAGGVSFTWHIGKYASYNTKRGAATINTPGLGSVTTSTKAQRKAKREKRRMWKAADAEYERQYFADLQAGKTPDMNGAPSTRGLKTPPARYRKPAPSAVARPATATTGSRRQASSAGQGRRQSRSSVVHAAEPRTEPRRVGGVEVTPSGVPMRPLRPAEYMSLTEAQRSEYAALPMSRGGIYEPDAVPGQTEKEWEAAIFPEYGGLAGWREHQRSLEVQAARPDPAAMPPGGVPQSAASVCVSCQGPLVNNRCPRCTEAAAAYAERQQGGQCKARTQDGTPCRNSANCPIPSHAAWRS
jgi:hypothetical protein